MDLIGFAVARSQATNKGLADADANRIGILGAFMPNPVTALVVGRSLADSQAPAPAPVVTKPPGGDEPPKPTIEELETKIDHAQSTARKAQRSAVEAGEAATEAGKAAAEAGKAATAAAKAAEDVKKAVGELGREVRTSFEQVTKRLDRLESGKPPVVKP